jgi:hypothetical protein
MHCSYIDELVDMTRHLLSNFVLQNAIWKLKENDEGLELDGTHQHLGGISGSHGRKMTVFWDVASCNLVEVYRRFRASCCLHHQSDELLIPEDNYLQTSICSKLRPVMLRDWAKT